MGMVAKENLASIVENIRFSLIKLQVLLSAVAAVLSIKNLTRA